MRSLVFSSLMILLAGCAASRYASLVPVEQRPLTVREASILSVPAGVPPRSLASVDAYGHHISGIMVLKADSAGAYRAAFMMQSGMTIFSLWMSREEFRVEQCIEELRDTPFFGIIANDLRSLLFRDVAGSRAQILKDPASPLLIYRIGDPDGTSYFYADTSAGRLVRLEKLVGEDRVWSMERSMSSGPYPDTTTVTHDDYDLRILLMPLPEEAP